MTITQQQAIEALESVYYATHASFIDRNLVRQYIEQSTAQPQAVVPAPEFTRLKFFRDLNNDERIKMLRVLMDLSGIPDDQIGTHGVQRQLFDKAFAAAQPSAQAERAPVVPSRKSTDILFD